MSVGLADRLRIRRSIRRLETFKTSGWSGALVGMRECDIDEPAQVVALPQPEPAAGLTGI